MIPEKWIPVFRQGSCSNKNTPDEALSAYGEVVWFWRRDAGAKLVRS